MRYITIKDSGADKYKIITSFKTLGRLYDNESEYLSIEKPESESGNVCTMIVTAGTKVIDHINVGTEPIAIKSNISKYKKVCIGFSFTNTDGYVKNSEVRTFEFGDALNINETISDNTTEQSLAVDTVLETAFINSELNGTTLEFYNSEGTLVGSVDLSVFTTGGIESISVNGVQQEIVDTNVDLAIPTTTSELTNDSGYITDAVTTLVNYYLKSETYSQEEINALIDIIPKFSIEVVDELPTENISNVTVYLVLEDEESNNLYSEYIYVNDNWEMLGSKKVDLSNYVDLTSEQDISGLKNFSSIGIIGEDLVPIYEENTTSTTYNYEYTIETYPSTGTYGFELNDDGYYESTNKGVQSSYAMCKVSFTMWEEGDLTFELINYAESSYDFGIFSQLDQELAASNTTDSSSTLVYKSYSGIQSATATTLTYSSVSAGEHFITIKYKKDASVDSGNDSLQFKITSPIGEVTRTETTSVLVGYENFYGLLDVDEDLDLVYNGEKIALNSDIVDLQELVDLKVNISDVKSYSYPVTGDSYWFVSSDNLTISTTGGTVSNVYNPLTGVTSDFGTLARASQVAAIVTAHNNLVNTVLDIPVVTALSQLDDDVGYLLRDELKVASEENFGVIKIWVEDDYLCISTYAYDNGIEDDELTVEGVYNLTYAADYAETSLIL